MDAAFALLAKAIRSNDTTGAAGLLQQTPELEARLNEPLPDAPFGGTALLVAVGRKNRDMIDLLLRAGADINGRSHWWAGSFGALDSDSGLEDFLIQRGATVDVHAAARLGRMDRLKELLDTDPTQVHARGGDGQTPLHFARNIAIAELLLARGADLDARDIDHESTAAQYMVRDRQDVARYLVQRGCRTDLLMASALGDIETVRRHLEADPECIRMNVSEDWFPKQDLRAGGSIYIWTLGPNKTAHAVAREFGHTEIFQLLMERSPADLKLGLACEYGNDALCRELLSADSDLARKLPHSERRRLVDAAQANNSAAVKRMLEAGWPLDGRGQHGATALHWAAFHGNAVMVRELIARGAPLEMKDAQYDGTPLGWAKHGSGNSWHRQTGDYEQVIRLLSN